MPPRLTLPPNLSGPKVLLQGEMGSGKTTSIRTLYDLGYEIFVLSVEPGIGDILGDLPAERVHWTYVPPVTPDFNVLRTQAKMLMDTHYDVIQKMGGVNKANHQEFFKLLNAVNNFKCDRTGLEYGDVGTWGADRVFVIDSLSGVTKIAIAHNVGDKPFLELRDYSATHWLISNFVNGVISATKAWVVMTAHLERETDPTTGRTELMVSTAGKALAPVLPRYFSDVILAKQIVTNNQATWRWDTLSDMARVKSRNLPLQPGLPANFKDLHENWLNKTSKGLQV